MTLPANLRVNTTVPFPSLVRGSGPVSITKVNGIWTVNLNFGALQSQIPSGNQLNTDFLVAWDSVIGNYFTLPLSFFGAGGSAPLQRSITSIPVIIAAKDQYLNLNLTAPATITLPGFASRNGLALNFKDVGMQATANPITIAAAAGETIDGFASVMLDTNGMEVNLVPFLDGLNTGWFVS